MLTATALAAVLLAGLTAGGLAFMALAVTTATPTLGSGSFVVFHTALFRAADPLMRIISVASVVLGLATLASLLSHGGVLPVSATAVGIGGLVVHVVVTRLVNKPVNILVAGWDAAAPPANWEGTRDRWNFYHSIRTIGALVGFLGYLLAAVEGM